jgi:hypothetical protein
VYRLSIVVPSIGSQELFEDTLASVLQHRPDACEILVPHSGTYDDPYELASEVRFIEVASEAGLAEVLNGGVTHAEAAILHLVLPGLSVQEGWTEAALERFADPAVGAVAPLVLDATRPDRVAVAGLRLTPGGRRVPQAAGARLERILRRKPGRVDGPWLAAGFFRRSLVQAVGGFGMRTHSTWLDIELALRLQSLGFHTELSVEPLMQSVIPVASTPRGFLAGRDAERVFWRAAAKQGIASRLVPHGTVVCAGLLRHALRPEAYADLLGRLVCLLDVSDRQRERRLLEQAAEMLEHSEEPFPEGRHHVIDPPDHHRHAA